MAIQSGTSFGQAMVNQGPRFENFKKRSVPRPNQVLSRTSKIIRPDKRKKVHYL